MTRKRLPSETAEHEPEALLLFSDILLLLEQKFISIPFKDYISYKVLLYLYLCESSYTGFSFIVSMFNLSLMPFF